MRDKRKLTDWKGDAEMSKAVGVASVFFKCLGIADARALFKRMAADFDYVMGEEGAWVRCRDKIVAEDPADALLQRCQKVFMAKYTLEHGENYRAMFEVCVEGGLVSRSAYVPTPEPALKTAVAEAADDTERTPRIWGYELAATFPLEWRSAIYKKDGVDVEAPEKWRCGGEWGEWAPSVLKDATPGIHAIRANLLEVNRRAKQQIDLFVIGRTKVYCYVRKQDDNT